MCLENTWTWVAGDVGLRVGIRASKPSCGTTGFFAKPHDGGRLVSLAGYWVVSNLDLTVISKCIWFRESVLVGGLGGVGVIVVAQLVVLDVSAFV